MTGRLPLALRFPVPEPDDARPLDPCRAGPGACTPLAVGAETLEWQLRSLHKDAADPVFHADTRNWQWPGGGKVCVVETAEARRFGLDGNAGETIRYGAWVRGNPTLDWGVGFDSKQACCRACGAAATQPITLQ